MMKIYSKPEINITKFDVIDIIQTSGLPEIPTIDADKPSSGGTLIPTALEGESIF